MRKLVTKNIQKSPNLVTLIAVTNMFLHILEYKKIYQENLVPKNVLVTED